MDITEHALTYGFHGVAEAEQALLQGMIRRISRRLPGPVTHVSTHHAQLVFLDDAAPPLIGSDARLVRLVRNPEGRQSPGALRMPPHVTELLDIFSGSFGGGSHERVRCGAMQSLVRSLHDLFRTRDTPQALLEGDGASLILYPSDRQFSWAGTQHNKQLLSEIFGAQRPPRLDLRALGAQELDACGERHGIEPLLWHMGLAHAHCGLLPWVGRDDVLRMRAWPYLAGQGPAAAMRLATTLRARPRSVAGLADAACVPETDAVAFANAALLCGFVVAVAPTDPLALPGGRKPEDAPMKVSGFARLPGILGAIRDALGVRS